MRSFLAALALLIVAGASRAYADPCEAIPDNGPTPTYLSFGASFAGPVAYVIDGDSLCVATGEGHEYWVEVRLADFFAPELSTPQGRAAKVALERIALGRQAECVANLRTYDRIAARCRIGGHPVGDMMREAGIAEGGRGTGGPVTRGVRATPLSAPARQGVFANCAAARAAGAAPMHRGDPGYSSKLDGDHDGIACEPYRKR
jgi:micrococcal nuclease